MDTKKFILILTAIIGATIVFCTEFHWIIQRDKQRHMERCKLIESRQLEAVHDTLFIPTDFPRTVRAIIDVESKGNPLAINTTSGASGLMQLMPIYVKEANRILKKNVYTLEDRFDPVKTLEMFCIIQDYHNPTQDTDKAIALHNGGESYYKLIKKSIF